MSSAFLIWNRLTPWGRARAIRQGGIWYAAEPDGGLATIHANDIWQVRLAQPVWLPITAACRLSIHDRMMLAAKAQREAVAK